VKRSQALALLILAGFVWSFGGVLIKWIPLGGFALAGWRSLFAALVVFAFRGFRIGLPRDKFALMGSITFALNTIFFVSATKLTTAANAIVLQYTAPIYVLLFSFAFLGESIRRRDVIAVLGTFVGLALMVADQLSPQGMQGNLYALAAGLSFGLTLLFLRKQAKANPYQIIFWGNILAIIFTLPNLLVQRPSPADIFPLLLLGCVFGGGYLLYTAGTKRIRATTAVLLAAVEPLLNPIWVWLLLGESPGLFGLVGGGIVLASVSSRVLKRTDRGAA
jgi:drug/metabolite transporter (DMT)-like permease